MDTKNDSNNGQSSNLVPTLSESKQTNQSIFPGKRQTNLGYLMFLGKNLTNQSVQIHPNLERDLGKRPETNKTYLRQLNFTKPSWITFKLPKFNV